MAQFIPETKTLVIDNFFGSMVSDTTGSVNSGYTNVVESGGYDSFGNPTQLHWSEQPVQIDAAGAVITDLIMCAKTRLESGIIYTYAVGHTGRVYKIQANDPTTFNPDYDNPVLLTTLTINSPTFTMGGFIDFFGSTSRIYIGHDKGVTQLNFDGTGEAFVGALGSWTQNVPRPLRQFVGLLCAGNGSNFAVIDSSLTVTSYAKIVPGLPSDYQVRDLDVTPDGNYLQAVATNLPLNNQTLATPNTSVLEPGDSIIAKWNGSDMAFTAFTVYPNVVLSANALYGNHQYVFGFDIYGGAIFNPTEKFITSTTLSAYSESPSPNAVSAYGGLITWISPYYFSGALHLVYSTIGNIEAFDLKLGWWSPLIMGGSGTEVDVLRIPCQVLVSNLAFGASTNGYPKNQMGSAKMYYSTLETSSTTTKYKLFKWTPAPTGLGSTGGTQLSLYQTQTQLFSKKVMVKEVRVYGSPWVANNVFTVDIIGADQTTPIPGCTKTFTAGTNLTIGDDSAIYNPQNNATYAIALRITNTGTTNNTISKVEIDYVPAGKK